MDKKEIVVDGWYMGANIWASKERLTVSKVKVIDWRPCHETGLMVKHVFYDSYDLSGKKEQVYTLATPLEKFAQWAESRVKPRGKNESS